MSDLGEFFISIGSKYDGKGLKGAADGIKEVGKLVAGFSVAFGGAMIYAAKKASDLEEATGKFNVVFRGVNAQADAFADNLVKNFGVSTLEARTFLSTIQDFLVPMGMTRKEAAGLSNEIVKLSADIGSFNNQPTEQVMQDIQSALTGMFIPMRKYGVALSAARIEQEIMNSGLVKNKDDITAQMKAQATYNIIMRDSSDALGDFARTQDSLANQTKILRAKIADLTAELGQSLLPVAKQIVTFAMANLLPMVSGLVSGFADFSSTTKLVIVALTGLGAALGPVIFILPQLTSALSLAKVATVKLWAAISAHPLVAVTVALSALTLGIAAYMEKSINAADKNRQLGNSTQSLIAIQQAELATIRENIRLGKVKGDEAQAQADKAILLMQSIANLESDLKIAKAEQDAKLSDEEIERLQKAADEKIKIEEKQAASKVTIGKMLAEVELKNEEQAEELRQAKLAAIEATSKAMAVSITAGLAAVANVEKLTFKTGTAAFKEAMKQRLQQYILAETQQLIVAKTVALAKAMFNSAWTFGAAAGQVGIILGAFAVALGALRGIQSLDQGGVIQGPPGKPVLVQALGGERFLGRQSIGSRSPAGGGQIVVNMNRQITTAAEARRMGNIIGESIFDRVKREQKV